MLHLGAYNSNQNICEESDINVSISFRISVKPDNRLLKFVFKCCYNFKKCNAMVYAFAKAEKHGIILIHFKAL
ncbi:hypothetical protein GCM10011344_22530 [Dokdonia pacifica]|nr:hypothetical protein GCM10011344_22530 [Dokdonia pacifica]